MEYQCFSQERQQTHKTTINVSVFELLYLTNSIPLTNNYSNYNDLFDLGLFLIRPKISEILQMKTHITVNANIKLKCCMYT